MKSTLLVLLTSIAAPHAFADSVAYSSNDYRLGSGQSAPSACMDLNQHYRQLEDERKRAANLAERCAADSSSRQIAIKYITSLGEPLPKELVPYAETRVAENVKVSRPITTEISDIVRESQQNYKAGGGRQIHRKPGAE